MLEDHVSNRLDSTTFPYVGDSPEPTAPPSTFRALPAATSSPTPSASGSLRSQRPNWHRAGTTQGAGGVSGGGGGAGGERGGREQVRQRLIVFVAGGVTYSEMRSAYLVGKATGKEIIIGTSLDTLSTSQLYRSRLTLVACSVSRQVRRTSLRPSRSSRTSSRSASLASALDHPTCTRSTRPFPSTRFSRQRTRPKGTRSCSTRCTGRRSCRPKPSLKRPFLRQRRRAG